VCFIGSCSSSYSHAFHAPAVLVLGDHPHRLHPFILCGLEASPVPVRLGTASFSSCYFPTAKSSEPIRFRSFWYPYRVDAPSSRRQSVRTHDNSTIFSRDIYVLWYIWSDIEPFARVSKVHPIFFRAIFAEFFYFKLIAGENSEKHVFYRVTNRFAVNLK
jgi:hypothetical protein